ncbi:transmembrane protein 144-like isoform X2 [Cyprinus carpio]|uniref:Transmembrane protein 144-like isoform X2 n=1 Tax=Cyprinus carpio TaxID=7962 RepID=A0A9Q9X2W5_CYPCA|nr:transmembrane protein 144-like isoform X2 [Cyprinus carpio]
MHCHNNKCSAYPLNKGQNRTLMALLAVIVLFVVRCCSTLSAEEPLSSNEASSTDATYGFVACVIAVLLYGSYFVPVKTVNTGDGMFFQWICCSAIWFVGLVTDTLFRPSRAHPAAMLGGALWATGNITAVPVVKFIGLGLGILLWGSSGLLIGWTSSSAIIFFFVRSDVQKRTSAESMPLLIDDRRLNPDSTNPSDSLVDTILPKSKRVL